METTWSSESLTSKVEFGNLRTHFKILWSIKSGKTMTNAVCMLATSAILCVMPGPAISDEFSDGLRALGSGNEAQIENAIAYFAKQPVDPGKQSDVVKALNELDKKGTRELTEAALCVWANKDSVPLIIHLIEDKPFDRGALLDLVVKLKDDRFLTPLVGVLRDPHDDGKRAESIIATWGKSADPIIVQHINDPDDETHSRLVRIWEQRKLKVDGRTLQSVLDLASTDKQSREYASEWLAKQKTIPDAVRKQATEFALKALENSKGMESLDLTEVIAQFGHESFRDEYLKLIESQEFHKWQSGLHGVILAGDVRCAKKLIARMSKEEFAGQVSKVMTRHGKKSEPLALALLKQPVEDSRGYAHIAVCSILGEVGTKSSLNALNQLANRKSLPESLRNAAKVSAAEIRGQNIR